MESAVLMMARVKTDVLMGCRFDSSKLLNLNAIGSDGIAQHP